MKKDSFIAPWLSFLCLTRHASASTSRLKPVQRYVPPSWMGVTRGGGYDSNTEFNVAVPADEERYSRQVFTLGARAQALVRGSTIYVDGPPTSGLLYECVKNLALSGVGCVVIWEAENNDPSEQNYHDAKLDDLGQAYCRAAADELGLNLEQHSSSTMSQQEVLAKYIRCLNPIVHVYHAKRDARPQRDDTHGVVLCIDRPYETQLKLNELARNRQHKFVAVETAGAYGRVFCDFGPSHQVFDADGETPLVTPLDSVQAQNGELLVRAIETEKHDVSPGDTIQFQLSNGTIMSQQFTVKKVVSPQRIIVKRVSDGNNNNHEDTLTTIEGYINQGAASYSRVKTPINLSFLPLRKVMAKAEEGAFAGLFTPCDFDKSYDEDRLKSVLASFQALSDFVQRHQSLPTLNNRNDFQQLVVESLKGVSPHDKHIRNFLSCCKGKLVPFQSFIGAIGAQEALKAVTGLYTPVNQFLLYDCDELLWAADRDNMDESPLSGLSYILGTNIEENVKSVRLFVIGAGAIGCELLKNLAAMGCGTGKNGCISLTDMDCIEKSNLSRQLLFRESNIGDYKSVAAKIAVLRFNPAVKLNAHTKKVGQEGDGPFGDDFWSSSIDVVLNALDNMEARLFVDQQCVSYQKALVDAGTLGPKGNVQVVVPHQSESYGSSVDPPESEIPVCTLKNFPYAISHTIQWSRDLFDGLFNRRPNQANKFAPAFRSSQGTADLAKALIRDLGDVAAIEAADELLEDLSFVATAQPDVRSEAVIWAVKLANRLFHGAVHDLLLEHPLDSLDEDGEPFWSGARKIPKPVRFSHPLDFDDHNMVAANENLLEFVQAAARLRIEMLLGGERGHIPVEDAREALMKGLEGENNSGRFSKEGEEASTEATILRKFQGVVFVPEKTLQSVDFEKDDDNNGHVQFVRAASNLRAMCYGIPPVDALETRRIAGKIIPAMITTTAVVSALSCIELLKLLQKAPFVNHRNAFINLALPLFAFTVPLPAEEVSGPRETKFTLWDKIAINQREDAADLTLKGLIRQVKKAITDDPNGLDVSTVSAGDFMIYANFLHGKDESLLRRSIWDLASEATSNDDEDETDRKVVFATRVDLRVTVEDTRVGEEYELPPVRLERASGKT